MTLQAGFRLPTDVDFHSEESLHHILRPEFHHLIGNWLRTASEREKQGIIKLARISEPTLNKTIGRPRGPGAEPSIHEANWYFKRGATQGGTSYMSRSSSGPSLMRSEAPEYMPPSWMHEDAAEISQIPKPGGYVVQLKDNTYIQRLKNQQRNSGTYKLFSGGFDDTTTTGSAHTLRSIGLEK
mmetsp:Transcript_42707/g.115170  ORF Transcript_42707/g.115170 Transcript_42707/m.115170 type:complete len:183 (-) Transcript_42707:102-650(-)